MTTIATPQGRTEPQHLRMHDLMEEGQPFADLDARGRKGARLGWNYPEGRATAWRRFVASLDGHALAPGSHDAVIAGALAVCDRFGNLLQRHFELHIGPRKSHK